MNIEQYPELEKLVPYVPMDEVLLSFPVIDKQRYAEIMDFDDEGSDDLIAELQKIFKAEAPLRIAELTSMVASQNMEAISKLAHRFRSTCYNVAAARMAEICKRIEDLSGQVILGQVSPQLTAEVSSLVRHLKDESLKVMAEIEITRIF
jgi:HPt (histidine-containing phosphotransfer) domain-containing protein